MAWHPKTAVPDTEWHPKTAEPEAAPAQPLEEEPPPHEAAGPPSESLGDMATGGLRSFVHGATKRGHDELFGELAQKLGRSGPHGLAPESGKAMKMPDGSMRSMESPQDVYRAVRDYERISGKQFSSKHPTADFLLQGMGDAASDVAIAGGKAIKPLYTAAMGAVNGFLGSDTDLTDDKRKLGDVGETALETGLGGALGYLVPKGAGVLAKSKVGQSVGSFIADKAKGAAKSIGDPVSEWLANKAGNSAMKAAGYIQKDLKPLEAKGQDLVAEQGRRLLDEGVVRGGRTVEDVAARIKPKLEEVGGRIGEVLKTADAKGTKPFDIDPFIEKGNALLGEMAKDPARAAEAAKLARLLKGYAALSGDNAPGYVAANKLKSSLQGSINWGTSSKNAQQAVKGLQHALGDEIDTQVEGASGQQAREALQEADQRYGLLKEAGKKASQGIARLKGNHGVGISEMLSGVAGAAAGAGHSGLGATALGLLSAGGMKLLRTRGDSTLAAGAYGASKAIPVALEAVVREAPEALGRSGVAVQRALQKEGPAAAAAYDWVLRKMDPAYAKKRDLILQDAEAKAP